MGAMRFAGRRGNCVWLLRHADPHSIAFKLRQGVALCDIDASGGGGGEKRPISKT
jgi:hypothetical protein